MILNFAIMNWMCYKDETTLALTSSLERQHMDTLTWLPGFRSKKALPIAAIYGANSSGKTAVFNALSTLKFLVTRDVGVGGLLPIRPFEIDRDSDVEPSVFDITFLAGDSIWRLVVEGTREGITYESLEVIREHSTVEVYERDHSRSKPFSFDEGAFEDPDHVHYAFKSTRRNQTFLGSAVSQNILELSDPFNWFAYALVPVGVESQAWTFATSAVRTEGFLEYAGLTLSRLDTGIIRLEGESVGIEAIPQDAGLQAEISALGPDETITVVRHQGVGDYVFEAFTVRKSGGKVVTERLRTVHLGADGVEYRLNLSDESSGTQRLLGLLPMLFDIVGPGGASVERVYVVDELDRCLHTMLVSRLIEDYLSTCGAETRKQLLFTTHDLLLMDQSLMRRDEMYIAQRDQYGCSELVSLSEYEGLRSDRDLVKSYLDGRFGGIPVIGGMPNG